MGQLNEMAGTSKPEGVRPRTPCFVEGSEVATIRGAVRIEDLRVGDLVLTRDDGYRPIRWIGAREFDGEALAAFPDLQPVRITRSTFVADTPWVDLYVSPQHRVLVSNSVVGQEGGDKEILTAASELVSLGYAEVAHLDRVVYYHMLFDNHAIVLVDGCWSESFLPEAAALDGLHDAQLREILTIFPELASNDGMGRFRPARAILVRETAEGPRLAA